MPALQPVVLIVEDDPLFRMVLSDDLSDADYQVIEAESVEAAEQLIGSAERIDALVTDIRMPGKLSGWDVAEAARRRDPDLPVIYMSGYTGGDERRVPGSVFIAKPHSLSWLLTQLERLLAARSSAPAAER